MNKRKILCGLLVLSTANNMEAESKLSACEVLPYLNENKQFFTRGFFTGLFSSGVKGAMPKKSLDLKVPEGAEVISENEIEKSDNKNALKQKLISSSKSAIETWPKKFVANSLATIGVAKIHGDTPKICRKNISSLPIPLLSQGFAMAMVKDKNMSEAKKMAVGYTAFWGAKALQCGCPVKTAFAVSAFAVGAAIYKSGANNMDIDPVSVLSKANVASNYYKNKDGVSEEKNRTFVQRLNSQSSIERA